MDQDYCIILDEVEELPPEPAEQPVPAEPDADLGSMFTCRDRDIYDKDDPPVIPASLYNLSQLVQDVNSSPTQEDPGVPARSPRTEAALQPVSLDWAAEPELYAPLPPVLEDDEQAVGLQQDPCLPSPPAEPIPLDQGCSRQRFEQESVQSEQSGPRVQEFV